MFPTKITIRVYGILINEQNEVLIADEYIRERKITKFPGGGLELGEGPAECVVREFMEETGQQVRVAEHLYTTDFYIQSQIDANFQMVGIYYKVQCETTALIEVNTEKDNITFRWVALNSLRENELTFDSERAVVRLLFKQFE